MMNNNVVYIDGEAFNATEIGYRQETVTKDAKGKDMTQVNGTTYAAFHASTETDLNELARLSDGELHQIEMPSGYQFKSTVLHKTKFAFWVSE